MSQAPRATKDAPPIMREIRAEERRSKNNLRTLRNVTNARKIIGSPQRPKILDIQAVLHDPLLYPGKNVTRTEIPTVQTSTSLKYCSRITNPKNSNMRNAVTAVAIIWSRSHTFEREKKKR